MTAASTSPATAGAGAGATGPLLRIDALRVEFGSRSDPVTAVAGLDLEVRPGEIVGLVGESGCGKTVTALSVLGLLPPTARVTGGRVEFGGRDLLRLPRRELRRVRGAQIAMVFQDPLTSLHPSLTIGAQLAEALLVHDRDLGRRSAVRRAVELLGLVGIPEPDRRARDYPHQWSGGMRQRAMIAMAIANRPSLVIADEPTSALDVTVQAQILELLRALRDETGGALLVITHDLGVVAELCDRLVVVYAGRVVEAGPVRDVFHHPAHPYTAGLLASVPRLDGPLDPGPVMVGQPPSGPDGAPGCPFEPRCRYARGERRCTEELPALEDVTPGHRAACHFRGRVDQPR